MAKKILKGAVGIFGGKKKKSAAPADGQPIITPLDGAETSFFRRRTKARSGTAQVGTILSQALGPDGRAKLGG